MFMVIKIILINLLFISLPILSSNASITSNNQGLSHLIAALTKIDKPKSLKVAKELTSANNSYELIIRRANLNVLDVNEISNAIEKISHQKGPLLKTISMSFLRHQPAHVGECPLDNLLENTILFHMQLNCKQVLKRTRKGRS